jgi:hypothetical protein
MSRRGSCRPFFLHMSAHDYDRERADDLNQIPLVELQGKLTQLQEREAPLPQGLRVYRRRLMAAVERKEGEERQRQLHASQNGNRLHAPRISDQARYDEGYDEGLTDKRHSRRYNPWQFADMLKQRGYGDAYCDQYRCVFEEPES